MHVPGVLATRLMRRMFLADTLHKWVHLLTRAEMVL